MSSAGSSSKFQTAQESSSNSEDEGATPYLPKPATCSRSKVQCYRLKSQVHRILRNSMNQIKHSIPVIYTIAMDVKTGRSGSNLSTATVQIERELLSHGVLPKTPRWSPLYIYKYIYHRDFFLWFFCFCLLILFFVGAVLYLGRLISSATRFFYLRQRLNCNAQLRN